MTIDISIVDRMSQRLEKAPSGKWYARTYDGSTVVYEDEITGYTGGTIPSEINDVYAAQRTAVLLGGRQVVSNTNTLTGQSEILDPATGLPISLGGSTIFKDTAYATKGKLSNNGGGATFYTSAGGSTFQVQTVLECAFDAVQIGIANSDIVPITGVTVCGVATAAIGAANSLAANNNSATWTDFTFGGATTGTLAVGSGVVATPVWTWTDIMSVPSVDRTDSGKTLPCFSVRLLVPTGQNYTIMNGPGAAGAGWESDTVAVGERPWRVRLQAGAFATNALKAGLTSTVSQNSYWPAILIRYWPRGSKSPKTLVVCYDSFGSSPNPGCAVNHYGWPELLQATKSTPAAPIEIVNAALGGASTTTIYAMAASLAPNIKNSALIFPNASGNDTGNSLAAAFINSSRAYKAKMRALCEQSGVTPVAGTMSPVDPTLAGGARAYGATDALRTSMNATDVASGMPVADISSACGTAMVSGQVILTNTVDGFHANDAGQALIVAPVAAALNL